MSKKNFLEADCDALDEKAKAKLRTDTSMFYPWGFWFNGQDVHVEPHVKSLAQQSYVVSKRDSHGEISHYLALGNDVGDVRQKAILSVNLGFTEANTYNAYADHLGEPFWSELIRWLEWKQEQKTTILAIRVWFSDGRIEDVGSVPV